MTTPPLRSPDRLLTGGRVVTPEGVLSSGWILLAGNLIVGVGSGEIQAELPSGLLVVDLDGQWVLPGFVDMHVHGGGGTSFTEGPSHDAMNAVEFHRRHGTTSLVASLVTAPSADLEARSAMLAGLADEGVIVGLHLEGPFLSPARRGAQDPRHMLAPDLGNLASRSAHPSSSCETRRHKDERHALDYADTFRSLTPAGQAFRARIGIIRGSA